MRYSERDILKERLTLMPLVMLLQKVDRVVRNRDGRIIPVANFRRGQRLIIQRVILGREVVVVIEQRIRPIKPTLKRAAVEVPFARMIVAVAHFSKVFRKEPCPAWAFTRPTT